MVGDRMKPLKHIYEQIYDYENLYRAYLNARKNKRYRSEVMIFTDNLEENLLTLQNELIYQTYKVGRYWDFYVYEPKKRLIMALPFRDRVVQWALYQIVNPIFTNQYITDSYACICGRGVHQAIKRVFYWLQLEGKKTEKLYYLKMDIAKFFYRVDHQVILDILSRKFADPPLLKLFDTIVNSEETPFGLPVGYSPGETEMIYSCGMPIGNLSSQMLANVILNELDQYAKRVLGIRYYIRYADDILILSSDKKELHHYNSLFESFLEEKLKLRLNDKTAIRPIGQGVEFVGFRIWPTHIKLRKKTVLKMKRRLNQIKEDYANGKIELEKVKESKASYYGLMQHYNSYRLRCKLSETFVLVRKGPDAEE